jgi:hypothetical protein
MNRVRFVTALALSMTAISAMAAIGRSAATFPGGVYRVTWTERQLLDAGATREYAHGNQGVLTWTLKGGRFLLDFGIPPLCHGTYTATGGTLSIRQGPGCHGLVRARWSLSHQQLRLRISKATDPGDRTLFGGKPWTRIR